ncbi:MAG: RCC1 domain-containing protein [Sandaracinaceae bacterium]
MRIARVVGRGALPALLVTVALSGCTLPFDIGLLPDGSTPMQDGAVARMDGGGVDAGRDAGGTDAGPLTDGGPEDGGPPPDGTTPDAGPISSCLVGDVLAAGSEHACVVDEEGGLYCWGSNAYGQLGLGIDDEMVTTPTRVGSALWVSVELGDRHSCAIDAEGDLYCWGTASNGRLGSPGAVIQRTPRKVSLLEGDWRSVSAGSSHTCGIFGAEGELFCWGSNSGGALGRTGGGELPGQVGADTGWTQVSAGWSSTCGIRGGELYCWGNAANGATGHGDEIDRLMPEQVGADTDWAEVACGQTMACARKTDGRVFCWGSNTFGQAGVAPSGPDVFELTQMLAPDTFSSISVGEHHSCGIAPDGQAWCWGIGSYGVRGDDGASSTGPLPGLVLGGDYTALAAGAGFSCGLDADRLVRCWGDNSWGAVGNGSSGRALDALTPTLIREGVVEVTSTTWASCMRTTAGEILCWGFQAFGGAAVPTPTLLESGPYDALSRGDSHGLLIGPGNALFGWGSNSNGQVGDGSSSTRFMPVPIPALPSVSTVVAGSQTSCAITGGGALHCWGNNASGQLGLGDNMGRDTPTLVSADGWTAIDTGGRVTCGVRDGDLFCWGENSDGSLGLGDTADRNVPTRVGTGSTWVSVGVDETVCAIDASGALFCWGDNFSGAVGNDGSSDVLTPFRVGTDTWVSVDTDLGQTCAIRSDGALFCWGDNDHGELGVGDREDHRVPTRVGTATDWTAVNVGSYHSCGLRGESLYCWGRAEHGRIGTGVDSLDANPHVPVAHCLDE